MRTRIASILTATAAALVLVACGGGDDSGDTVDARRVDAALSDATETDAAETDAAEIDAPSIDAMVDARIDAPTDAMPTPSESIGFVRAASGAVSLPVSDVTVTYLKPAGANTTFDPAGFTVQAVQNGPAVMIAIDPSTLTPAPVVGDVVSFTVTNVAVVDAQPRVTALTGFTRVSQGADVNALVQDVTTATDVGTAVGNYDSEIVDVTADVAAACTGGGTGFEQCQITTTGITAATAAFTVRLPTTLRNSTDLAPMCDVVLNNVPVHRFMNNAQLSPFVASEIAVSNCPAPTVLAALATSATTVNITFTRNVANVNPDGSQFTFTGGTGLTASAASVSGRVVTVTTDAQTSGTLYTVTVANSVTDTYNTALGTPATTMFAGFTPAVGTHLVISEVKTVETSEFIEIFNPTAETIDLRNYYLSDHQSYFTLPGSPTLSGIDSTDFLSRFPMGATIGPRQVITIATDAVAFTALYSSAPTYSLEEVGTSIAMESVWASANPGRGITNTGEVIALFYWDGTSDNVKDVDLFMAGNAPSASNNFIAKTAVDGPDADTATTAYASDAMTLQTMESATTGSNTYKRVLLETTHETQAGTGNGITGDDESSEQTRTTWDSQASAANYSLGTPGTVPASINP
jgi:hypothetical protein